jgi:hypothetical protein
MTLESLLPMPTWTPKDLVNYAKRQPFKTPAKSGYNKAVVVAFFKEHGIPEPALEFKFHTDRKWRFDIAWRNYSFSDYRNGGLALEVEGGVWVGGAHNRGAGFVKDMEKYNEAAALGWRVIRCQPQDLCTMETVTLIKRCLGL